MGVMTIDLHDIQSNVLRGYRVGEAEPHQHYVWLQFHEATAARRTLAALHGHVTSCARWDAAEQPFVLNVALTYRGLQRVWSSRFDMKLGCVQSGSDERAAHCKDPEHSVLVGAEFVEGMRSRAAILGDVGDSAPEHWETPLGSDRVSALVTISGADDAAMAAGRAAVTAALGDGATIAAVHEAAALPGKPPGTEHFGFVDGIGQPFVDGSGLAPRPGEGTPEHGGWTPVAAGEFVLGYPGETGSTSADVHPWLVNSSYLAMRRLEERVAEFREYTASTAKLYGVDDEWVAAKMIGRWRSGTPVELSPDHDDPSLAADPARNNDFLYDHDREGLRCPFGAHLRRANPRDDPSGPSLAQVRQHRIIRRAVPYGPWLPEGTRDDAARGVMFGVVNADLRQQFEYVQLNWVNGEISSHRLTLAADRDPVVGAHDGKGKLVIPRREGPVICWDLPRFVRVRGGEYFLIPSLTLLKRLAEVS
jgi:Dyp-type peroxidase family